ncbi:uncharacterized protein KGF55_004389 [Candida pseudojiufengensis]|uniref:uncharacterized protein n=1 Tax=Candida pseudojiufengensis TaxID=497109 RepID=UPI002225068F|nr:uncharacterized protein KGF55_004389 [Candida pseudojiufengensis]KAI5960819.1 hypothetical protein KGF55_004389 [Candida pseudojiufengensis]
MTEVNIIHLIYDFRLERILNSNTQTKQIAILGTIDEKHAILIIEKSPFNLDRINNRNSAVLEIFQNLSLINSNDVYNWAKATLKQDLSQLPAAKVNLIYPATETHIRKYNEQKLHYVRETPEMYNKYVIPYIETMKGDRLKWVYNILFEGKEFESVIYHDKSKNGFVLLPDMKWDKVNLENLYLCCIVNRMDIGSIRDLSGDDVKYLKNLQFIIRTVTFEKFGLSPDELKIFVHYQPSYYHFHLHIVNVHHPGLGDGIAIGKAILLDDVIDNLKLDGDYYKKKTISYVLGENHGLWQIEGYRDEC